MALTQISTAGVKDDAVTAGKIPANAVGSSELADNAVDTNAIQDQAVALSKLPHGDSNNNGKFLRANNGADPTFETVNLSPNFGNQEIITTDTVKTPSINDGQVAFRNMVVNGNFMVNQRAVSYTHLTLPTILLV